MKIFEIPLSTYFHDYNRFKEEFEPFVAEYKDYINDIYFTYNSDVFIDDAMGLFDENKKNEQVLKMMLYIQDNYKVNVCPTFNNIYSDMSDNKLNNFMDTIELLSDMGIKMFQVPYMHWMINAIRDRFPDLIFKDTVLQRRYTPQDLWVAGEAGYDYVNVDRNVIRDEDTLINIKKMKSKFRNKFGRDLKIVLLANEACAGRCPVMDEHYMFNSLNKEQYFESNISQNTCLKWKQNEVKKLKIANIFPLKSEVDRMLKYVDVIKMHGRGNVGMWYNSVEFITNYVKGNELLIPSGEHMFNKTMVTEDRYKKFISFTKNCKFQCWDCDFCEKILK
jgi:hypothetical protein